MKPVEKIYLKKTQLEHIFDRPDTYIGSKNVQEETMWVFDPEQEKFEYRKIAYCPGLYKIFDEILVNAADNYQRDRRMTRIEVNIKNNGEVTVLNDGHSIPVQIHKQYKVYVAELIFGHLLTSSNYEDTEKKTTGGRNGYGAKLANIFSKHFEVETADASNKKTLTIRWTNNMKEMSDPVISEFGGKEYTRVTFLPDFNYFGMKRFSDDMLRLFEKRVYDLAGILKVKVFLNGSLIKTNTFESYANLYLNDQPGQFKIPVTQSRWKIILAPSDDTQFQHVSFVNSICTYKGGTHINHVMDQIVEELLPSIKKKHKDIEVKPAQIKSHFFLFLTCAIENPSFDSQCKENMTTRVSDFGSAFTVTDTLIKEILKTDLVDRLVNSLRSKQSQKISRELKKKKGQRLLIPKLQDANMAGKQSLRCTLILTEGDSAKSLAMSGIEKLGRDYYGVFPLKGKLANVFKITPKQIMSNKDLIELKYLIQIIGLDFVKDHSSLDGLRYGSVMIMADQDNDGSHIKGLVLNFFNRFWPKLCKINGFLKEFVTPIVRCRKGDEVKDFFALAEYNAWRKNEPEVSQGWKIKYYKGLGTSTVKEAQEYFSRLERHRIVFIHRGEDDDQALIKAFDPTKADLRKEWLASYNPDVCIDHSIKALSIRQFVDEELIHFSNADNIRSIPSLIDGLKPSQRKILFSCFKRNLRSQIKVAQLAGYVAQHSAYHHGEVALSSTIIGMAQDFVGSNNLNLLLPIGQFGTRNLGGKDSASPRYIYTALNPLTRFLFPEADDNIVEYLVEEDQTIEPKYYYPILPLVLINGAEGIGTGWSTNVNPYLVKDVIQMVRDYLSGVTSNAYKIGWENFKGEIESTQKGFLVKGIYELNDNVVRIRELPIKKWTRDYKSFLQQKLQHPDNEDPEFQDLRENHSGDSIDFTLVYLDEKIPSTPADLQKSLKLTSNINNSNMVLFTADSKIKKYEGVEEIIQEFAEVRLKAYRLRKEYLVSKLERQLVITSMKIKFIRELLSGAFSLLGDKNQWMKRLAERGYKKYAELPRIQSTKHTFEESTDDRKDFNYLLNLPIWSLTGDKLSELERSEAELEFQLRTLHRQSLQEMWLQDIEAFENAWFAARPNQVKNNSSPNKKIMMPRPQVVIGAPVVPPPLIAVEEMPHAVREIMRMPIHRNMMARPAPLPKKKIKAPFSESSEEEYAKFEVGNGDGEEIMPKSKRRELAEAAMPDEVPIEAPKRPLRNGRRPYAAVVQNLNILNNNINKAQLKKDKIKHKQAEKLEQEEKQKESSEEAVYRPRIKTNATANNKKNEDDDFVAAELEKHRKIKETPVKEKTSPEKPTKVEISASELLIEKPNILDKYLRREPTTNQADSSQKKPGQEAAPQQMGLAERLMMRLNKIKDNVVNILSMDSGTKPVSKQADFVTPRKNQTEAKKEQDIGGINPDLQMFLDEQL